MRKLFLLKKTGPVFRPLCMHLRNLQQGSGMQAIQIQVIEVPCVARQKDHSPTLVCSSLDLVHASHQALNLLEIFQNGYNAFF